MNLILLYPADRIPGTSDHFRLRDHRRVHLLEVLKVSPGQKLRVGLLDGPRGEGEVVTVAAEEIVVRAECHQPPDTPLTDLVLALPRPKSLKKLLPEIAALGVGRLTLLRTWRVEKSYLTSSLLRPEEHQPLFDEGLMQAEATRRPEFTLEARFRPYVEDQLPALLAGRLGLVAHPGAPTRLAELALAPEQAVTVALGPEGGFLPFEIELLEVAGMRPVDLGPRILRVETAVVAVLANLELLRQRGLASADP
jgi:16S rRNA (uracil1498-N3)-methyltransferase